MLTNNSTLLLRTCCGMMCKEWSLLHLQKSCQVSLHLCVSFAQGPTSHTLQSTPSAQPSRAPSETSTLRALVSIDLACAFYPSSRTLLRTPPAHPSCALFLRRLSRLRKRDLPTFPQVQYSPLLTWLLKRGLMTWAAAWEEAATRGA